METSFHVGSRKIVSDPKCIKWFSTGVALGFFYFLMMFFGYLSEPIPVIDLYWAVTKLIIAYSLVCFYRTSGKGKYAGGGIVVTASALLTSISFLGSTNPLAVPLDAITIAIISLTLYDIDKAAPGIDLEKPAGIIFLGLMLSLVGQPMMAALGLLGVILGMVYSTNKLGVVYSYSMRLKGGDLNTPKTRS